MSGTVVRAACAHAEQSGGRAGDVKMAADKPRSLCEGSSPRSSGRTRSIALTHAVVKVAPRIVSETTRDPEFVGDEKDIETSRLLLSGEGAGTRKARGESA